jgi:hypothetical protein
MIRTRTLALVLTFWFGCATPGTGTLLDIPFETLDRGTTSAIRERTYVVARSADEVAALWRAHRGVAPPAGVAGRTVIAVFAGERRTGGYQIDVDRVEARGDRVRVHLRETVPPPGTLVTQSLTYPYHIVAIAPTNLAVEFHATVR